MHLLYVSAYCPISYFIWISSFFQIWIILIIQIILTNINKQAINNSRLFHSHFLLGVSFLSFHQSLVSVFPSSFFCLPEIFRMWINILLWWIIFYFSYESLFGASCLLLCSYCYWSSIVLISLSPTHLHHRPLSDEMIGHVK